MKNSYWAVAGAAILVSAAASATSVPSNSFTVKLTITANCTINAVNNIDFGSTSFLTTALQNSSQGVTVNCTKGTPATISLAASSGAAGSRKLSNGTDTLNYELYSDSAFTTPWSGTPASGVAVTGAGVDSSGDTLDTNATTGTRRIIYAQVPAQTVKTVGVYQDTVIATVTF